MSPECGYDLGDCDVTCNSHCNQSSQLGNGICDDTWNIGKCNLDNGDCGFCSNVEANGCDSDKLANDTCDNECISKYCNFDNNACGDDFWNSDKTWHISMIDNGVWDQDCAFSEDCDFDGDDCSTCAPGCY